MHIPDVFIMSENFSRLSKDDLIHIIKSMNAIHRAKTTVSIMVQRIESNSNIIYNADLINPSDEYIRALANLDVNVWIQMRIFACVATENMVVLMDILGIFDPCDPSDQHPLCDLRCECGSVEITGDVRNQVYQFIKSLPQWSKFRWEMAW